MRRVPWWGSVCRLVTDHEVEEIGGSIWRTLPTTASRFTPSPPQKYRVTRHQLSFLLLLPCCPQLPAILEARLHQPGSPAGPKSSCSLIVTPTVSNGTLLNLMVVVVVVVEVVVHRALFLSEPFSANYTTPPRPRNRSRRDMEPAFGGFNGNGQSTFGSCVTYYVALCRGPSDAVDCRITPIQ